MPDETHSPSQLSRLCHACQCILTRDDLEVDKYYTHHSSPEDLIEANRMKCYVCEHVFRSLGSFLEDIQDILRQAAKEEMADGVVQDDTRSRDDSASDSVAEDETQSTDHSASDLAGIFRSWMSDRQEGREPCVSFTELEICCYRGSYLLIQVGLNPFYEGFFPPNTKPYDILLGAAWEKLRFAFLRVKRLMIVPDQGISILN